jgi:hypothetical protein
MIGRREFTFAPELRDFVGMRRTSIPGRRSFYKKKEEKLGYKLIKVG